MFEIVFDLEDTINLLELERILFERKEGHTGCFLDSEEFYIYTGYLDGIGYRGRVSGDHRQYAV